MQVDALSSNSFVSCDCYASQHCKAARGHQVLRACVLLCVVLVHYRVHLEIPIAVSILRIVIFDLPENKMKVLDYKGSVTH